jgi:HK97 family phage prohead protease
MTELRRCSLALAARGSSLNEETRSARFVASTADVDSYGEVVEQYWDLARFRANPVILFAHNRGCAGFWGDALNSQVEALPVGKATVVEVVGSQLEIEVQIVDEKASPLAEYVWQGMKQGTLRTVSVGFMPGERVREERQSDSVVYHIGTAKEPNELYEVSIVVIPANAAAVMKAAPIQQELPGIHAGEQPPPAAERVRMDPEQIRALQAQLEARTAELATATGRAEAAESELDAEKKAHDATKAELKAANDARDATEKAAIEAEVKALSGVKFLPAELEDEIEIRTRKGAEYWRARMDARSALGYTEQSIAADKTAKNAVAAGRRRASTLLQAAHKAASEVRQ